MSGSTVWLIIYNDPYSHTDASGHGITVPQVLAVCATEKIADTEVDRLANDVHYQRDLLAKQKWEVRHQ